MKLIPAPPGSPRGAFSFARHLGAEANMGLLDQAVSFGHGASNGVSSMVTGPVDGLSWLLSKAGVPMPQEPLLGSEWMRSRGLMQEPRERVAGLLGEGVGAALPGVLAYTAPKIASGLLQVGDNIASPTTLGKQAGVIRATFKEAPIFGDRVKILDDGTAVIEKASVGFKTNQDYADEVFRAAREKFGTQYDHYFRFTNNKDELSLARSGLLRPSWNHADNFAEAGLSVADGVHYGMSGYKYGYPVNGRFVGHGSDGEVLLDPKRLEVLSSKLQTARELMARDKALQAEVLRKAGLPADYFNGVVFTNNRHTFK